MLHCGLEKQRTDEEEEEEEEESVSESIFNF